jgi:glycosyltransferase involved in cell wall biosynthesis
MSEPPTILHLIWELDDGGLELMLTSLVTKMDRKQAAPFVICFGPEGDLSGAIRHTGVPLHHLNVHRSSEIRAALHSLSLLSQHIQPALVHCWTRPGDPLTSIRPDHLSTTVPVLTSTLSAPPSKGLLGFFTRSSSSDAEAPLSLPIRPAVDLQVLRADDVLRTSLRDRWSLPQDAVVVGMSARQLPPPDYSTYFHAMAQLQGLMPNLHIILTGREAKADRPEIAKLRSLCPRPDRVHLLGVQTEMGKIIPAWDLTVNCVTSSKLLPLTIAESLACGVPVVSTDQAGATDFLQDAGHVVKPADITALKDACIDILCRTPEARRQFREQARKKAEAAFDLAQLSTTLQQRYTQLLRQQ